MLFNATYIISEAIILSLKIRAESANRITVTIPKNSEILKLRTGIKEKKYQTKIAQPKIFINIKSYFDLNLL